MTNGTEKSHCEFLKACALGTLVAVAYDPLHRLETNDPNRSAFPEV